MPAARLEGTYLEYPDSRRGAQEMSVPNIAMSPPNSWSCRKVSQMVGHKTIWHYTTVQTVALDFVVRDARHSMTMACYEPFMTSPPFIKTEENTAMFTSPSAWYYYSDRIPSDIASAISPVCSVCGRSLTNIVLLGSASISRDLYARNRIPFPDP